MKARPSRWNLSPLGQPSYWVMSSHSPLRSMRKMRPNGMSTHQRLPLRSNDGPSRKLSTSAPPRFGSDQAVRPFFLNFAGIEVNGFTSMRSISWKGLCMDVPGLLLLHAFLDRVLDVLDLVDLDVHQPAAHLVDAADVHGLHDVARLRVDRYRAARALPLHALRRRDERLAVGLAAGLLQRLVDQVHAVPAAHAEEVGIAAVR